MIVKHRNSGPILNLVQIKSKTGGADALRRVLAYDSAETARDTRGYEGHFLGPDVEDGTLLLWASVQSGPTDQPLLSPSAWQRAYLPKGYEALVDTCTVHQVDLSDGWYVHVED
jgi:hypothetical protein